MQITARTASPRHIESLTFRLSVSILFFDISNYLELKISKPFNPPFTVLLYAFYWYPALSLGVENLKKNIQSNNNSIYLFIFLIESEYSIESYLIIVVDSSIRDTPLANCGKGKFPGARVIWLREDRSRVRHEVATLCKLLGLGSVCKPNFLTTVRTGSKRRSCKILKQWGGSEGSSTVNQDEFHVFVSVLFPFRSRLLAFCHGANRSCHLEKKKKKENSASSLYSLPASLLC